MDLRSTSGEHVLRRDVAHGTVQPDVMVTLDRALHQSSRIFQRQRFSRPDALSFARFVPSFDLPIRLGMARPAFAFEWAVEFFQPDGTIAPAGLRLARPSDVAKPARPATRLRRFIRPFWSLE